MKARDGFSFLHTDTTVDCSNLLWSIYRRKRAREKGKTIIVHFNLRFGCGTNCLLMTLPGGIPPTVSLYAKAGKS